MTSFKVETSVGVKAKTILFVKYYFGARVASASSIADSSIPEKFIEGFEIDSGRRQSSTRTSIGRRKLKSPEWEKVKGL